ncbi:hypothetical protein MP228_000165 [Amoeboaphelidium protococcarum]|nr:hypothetical protein MP228_000165 [Amoeboaphelidium protococcarum]
MEQQDKQLQLLTLQQTEYSVISEVNLTSNLQVTAEPHLSALSNTEMSSTQKSAQNQKSDRISAEDFSSRSSSSKNSDELKDKVHLQLPSELPSNTARRKSYDDIGMKQQQQQQQLNAVPSATVISGSLDSGSARRSPLVKSTSSNILSGSSQLFSIDEQQQYDSGAGNNARNAAPTSRSNATTKTHNIKTRDRQQSVSSVAGNFISNLLDFRMKNSKDGIKSTNTSANKSNFPIDNKSSRIQSQSNTIATDRSTLSIQVAVDKALSIEVDSDSQDSAEQLKGEDNGQYVKEQQQQQQSPTSKYDNQQRRQSVQDTSILFRDSGGSYNAGGSSNNPGATKISTIFRVASFVKRSSNQSQSSQDKQKDLSLTGQSIKNNVLFQPGKSWFGNSNNSNNGGGKSKKNGGSKQQKKGKQTKKQQKSQNGTSDSDSDDLFVDSDEDFIEEEGGVGGASGRFMSNIEGDEDEDDDTDGDGVISKTNNQLLNVADDGLNFNRSFRKVHDILKVTSAFQSTAQSSSTAGTGKDGRKRSAGIRKGAHLGSEDELAKKPGHSEAENKMLLEEVYKALSLPFDLTEIEKSLGILPGSSIGHHHQHHQSQSQLQNDQPQNVSSQSEHNQQHQQQQHLPQSQSNGSNHLNISDSVNYFTSDVESYIPLGKFRRGYLPPPKVKAELPYLRS